MLLQSLYDFFDWLVKEALDPFGREHLSFILIDTRKPLMSEKNLKRSISQMLGYICSNNFVYMAAVRAIGGDLMTVFGFGSQT